MRRFEKTTKKPLGELLIERGVINHEQLTLSLEHQKEHKGLLGEILVELNFATEADIVQALTCQYGFPYLPLSNYEIGADIISTVSKEICIKGQVIPVDKIGKNLSLAMSNPLNVDAAEEVERATGCVVQAFVCTMTDLKQSIKKYYS